LLRLDLAGNSLGDGAESLAASPHLGRLGELNLVSNSLSTAAVLALARSHNLAGLYHLELGTCTANDEVARVLLSPNCPLTLAYLGLRSSLLSQGKIEALRERYGDTVG
jgi:hypothetical protein